jgi:integrase/recombinase XerC
MSKTLKGAGSELVPVPSAAQVLARAEVDLVGAFLSGRKATTLRAYDRDLNQFARYLALADARSGMAALLSLAPGKANAVVLLYRSHMIERGLTAATVSRRLAAVRSCVKLARTLGLVTWSLDVESPKAVPYRDTRGPGDAGWVKLLAAAEVQAEASDVGVRDRAILRLLRGLGLRRSELVALDLADVELSTSRLWITGKGRSDKEVLTIPVRAYQALLEWVEVRGRWEGPLFCRLDRAAGDGLCRGRITDQSVYKLVKRLGERAGLARRVSPHQLRHLGITQALDRSGGNLRAAQKFSRHVDPRTLNRYDDNRTDLAGDMARLVDED